MDEMMKALIADGEKLRQLTGEEHGPYAIRVIPCQDCGGDGGHEIPRDIDRTTGALISDWQECRRCGGTGDEEIELQPITPDDLTETP